MNDSDTESEPESALPKCSATDFAQAYNLRDNEESNRANSAQNAVAAFETLRSLDLEVVQRDTSLHETIQKACDDILHFLDDILASNSAIDRRVQDDLRALADLCRAFRPQDVFPLRVELISYISSVHTSFLSTLFRYRHIFHRIASRAVVPGTAVPIIVCWVDVLLVKLGEVIVFVAGGFCPENSERPLLLPSLKAQREDDKLMAAAQLPHKREYVPGIIASEHASPAAKRLALRLTFASYVMVPHLKSCDPWDDGGMIRGEMMKVLQAYLQQLSVTQGSHSASTVDHANLFEHERIAYTMIISLFAATESRRAEDAISVPFRPHTLATLLSLIQFIMHSGHTSAALDFAYPIEELDLAQTILVRWGETVPFCWMIWDDQRIAHMESISHLTATWLYHLDVDLSSELFGDEGLEKWKDRLTCCLAKEPASANSAILQILHNCLQILKSQQNDFVASSQNVLFKTCWAVTQLVNPTVVDGWKTSSAVRTCELLCNVFVLLGNSVDELNAKDLMIEALTYSDPDSILSALGQLQKDNKVHFTVKLEEVITKTKRKLLRSDGTTLPENDLLTTKILLNFLTIMWHSGTEGGVHHHTLSCFLTALVNWLSNEPHKSVSMNILLDSSLTALAALKGLRSGPISNDASKFRLWEETIWQLAVDSSRSNIVVASAFATLILATPEHHSYDPLSCAEAWDYLRDIILLTISHHFLGDDEPLALIVAPAVCSALLLLLQRVGPTAVRFVLSSPWTMNLCADLRGLSSGDSLSEYSSILATRLIPVGTILLSEMSQKLHSDPEGSSTLETPSFEFRLMFSRISSIPRLMLVPRNITEFASH